MLLLSILLVLVKAIIDFLGKYGTNYVKELNDCIIS